MKLHRGMRSLPATVARSKTRAMVTICLGTIHGCGAYQATHSPNLSVAAKSSLESRLQTTASPELQAELFAMQMASEWAARRVKYAEQKLSDAKLFTNKDYDDSPNNFGPSDRQVMAGRLRRWTAEAKFANEALATARHHEAELIEKMKNE